MSKAVVVIEIELPANAPADLLLNTATCVMDALPFPEGVARIHLGIRDVADAVIDVFKKDETT